MSKILYILPFFKEIIYVLIDLEKVSKFEKKKKTMLNIFMSEPSKKFHKDKNKDSNQNIKQYANHYIFFTNLLIFGTHNLNQ